MSDYDRNKFYNKKKYPPREPVNFGSRFFNNKAAPHKDIEKNNDMKPKSIKKTTILAREHHAEDRSVSPKNVTKEGEPTPSITIAQPAHTAEAGSQHRIKEMTKCTKLLDEGVICPENIQDYLQENDDYLVVGIVGTQGVGKSTVLNLLAHNNITDKLKKSIFKYSENSKQNTDNIKIFSDSYIHQKVSDGDTKTKVDDVIFKPQNLSDLSNNCNGTNGIDFFVTHNRIMFLDCQPFTSVAVLDEFIRSEAKLSAMVSEFTPLENSGEIQGLQMTAFLMSICHVLILVQDWFFDSNALRFIESAEMLKPTISNPEDELVDHFPHLILIHNKAQIEDFSPKKFKQMQQIYKSIFNKTKMHIESGMGIGSGKIMNSLSPEICGDPINLFLIPEYNETTETLYRGHPPLEELVRKLRSNILGATKYPLSNTSEKHWLVYCSKVWDHVKKSNFFVEYNKLMPNTPEIIQTRFDYAVQYNRIMLEREKIYFIDEYGIQVNSRVSYGRSMQNTRASKIKAQLRGRNYSVAAAMNTNSLYVFQIQDMPYNAVHFSEFLTFINHLHQDGVQGAHIVMDNVRFHRNEEVLALIRAHGHFPVFVPPYSPFLNPIEELFSQWKQIIKRVQPSNENELYEAVHNASEHISPENCLHYVQHMESYLHDCLQRNEILN